MRRSVYALIWLAALCLAVRAQQYDVIIRNGTVYDGSGKAPSVADIAISGDHIARVGNLRGAHAKTEVDAKGLAVAPGFINMVFDPAKIEAPATYEKPHQYAKGMVDVWVNGALVLKDGEHTGAKPGRVVYGPGLKKD